MANKLYLLLFVLFFSSYFHSVIEEDPLPALGDYSSASISLSGEYELGRLWLAMYRGSTKEHSDPLMRTYLEDLIYRLSETSEVRDRRFEFIILEDKTINELRQIMNLLSFCLTISCFKFPSKSSCFVL